jgi:hypothetical protein
MAAPVTQPGETVGLALGMPIPPGFYFVDTSDWGVRNLGGGISESVGVTIPVILWSTPWKVLGARVEFLMATPALEVGTTSGIARTPFGPRAVPGTYNASMYNPFISGTLAWDLGGGFGFSYSLGSYIGVSDALADKSSFLVNRGTLSYTANGWNLTASTAVGSALDTVNPLMNPNPHPDYLNIDLTATKTFGKWELGPVGFYSTDLDTRNQLAGFYLKQSQFALGGLVGYDWGPLKAQVYVTRDVYEQNYGGYDTRVWGRVVFPLGDPFGPGSPGGMMYHK